MHHWIPPFRPDRSLPFRVSGDPYCAAPASAREDRRDAKRRAQPKPKARPMRIKVD